jgi:hypothetical protein
MTKKDRALLLLAVAYTGLFYHQHAGINFLLFTILTVMITFLLNRGLVKNRNWWMTASLTLLSGVFVFMYASSLSLLANLISLLLLVSYNGRGESSILFKLIHSIYSIGGSVVFSILSLIRKQRQADTNGKRVFSRVITVLVPLLLSIVFLILYNNANPLFASFTQKIDLSFISVEWLLFALSGTLIVYGMLYYHKIAWLEKFENNLALSISQKEEGPRSWNEKRALILLFVLLNGMLLFINLLDVNYLYLGAGMPEGVTHKQFVHNGVGTLVLSIALGISTILYFFRGELNFSSDHRTARLLVYAWLLQNVVMIVSTALRNHLYIVEALLTYKRIGVYFWLLMTLTGLAATGIKLAKTRTAWYIVKINAAMAYVILVLSAGVDWDQLITRYNMQHIKDIGLLDKKYLVALSETNLAALYAIKNDPDFNSNCYYHYQFNQHYHNASALDAKLYFYLLNEESDDWRSHSLRKSRCLKELAELNARGIITSLDLSRLYRSTLRPVFAFGNITSLNISGFWLESLTELSHFPKLRTLDLGNAHRKTLDSLPRMEQLTRLSLADNAISDLKALERVPALQALDLSNNGLPRLGSLPPLSDLQELMMDGNAVSNLSPLENYRGLTLLSLANYKSYLSHVPNLPSLQSLDISYSPFLLPILTAKPPVNLRHLNLNGSAGKNPAALLLEKDAHNRNVPKFKYLEELRLSANDLYHIDFLQGYASLKTLILNSNKLTTVNSLSQLKQLETLSLAANELGNIAFLDSLPALKDLDLSSNPAITDFTPLKHNLELQQLSVAGTAFSDLSVIGSRQLRYLHLGACTMESLAPLAEFTQLETLYVSRLTDEDIKLLQKLPRLKELYINHMGPDRFEKLKDSLRQVRVIEFY